MKRITYVLVLLLGLLTVPESVCAQNERQIVLKMKNASLKDILWEIEKHTSFKFMYNTEDLNKEAVKDVDFTSRNIDEVLKYCLKGTNLTHVIQDNVIVVKPQATGDPQPQSVPVTGSVKDAQGAPLTGVTILIKGTTEGTFTDVDGRFQLPLEGEKELVFSFVGFKTVEMKVKAGAKINLTLEEVAVELGDVVVTGIFTKPRESYTGAVSTINQQELRMYRGQHLISTLRNIDPSINVRIDNQWGSNPNKLPEMTIRGNSSLPTSVQELNAGASQQLNAPLVIMDGFEISLRKLMDFNDEEIASINILKDAAATAIYGSRGANGVIVITTKSPEVGKLRVTTQAGLNVEIPDLSSYDLLNAAEKLELEKIVGLYEDKTNVVNDLDLKLQYNEKYAAILRGVDTDWLSKPLQAGIGQRYNLRLEGGADDLRYSLSLGYNNTTGAMKGSKRDNLSGTMVLAYYMDNLIFKNQLIIDYNNGTESSYGNFSTYANMNPYYAPKDESGAYVQYWTVGTQKIGNPLYDAGLNTINRSNYNTLTNNFSVEWKIIDHLKLRGQLGISKQHNSSDYYLPPNHSSFNTDAYNTGDSFFRKGRYDYTTGEDAGVDGNLTLNYSNTFNEKHQIYGGIDYSISQRNSYLYYVKLEGFADEDLDFFGNAIQYASGTKPSGEEYITRRIGLTSNFTYTFDNRYYLDLSFRTDGSSQFGKKNKFAPFWSAGVGWNLHREQFLKDSETINNLRLKASFGKTGSQQFSSYQALMMFQYYSDKRYIIWNGSELMGLGNENLKWQISDKVNVGLEWGLWNSRITGQFDIYSNNTSNLLSQMDIPLSTGFSSYTDNVGEVKSTGFEAVLTGYLLRNDERNIRWSITGKLAYNNNEIVKLSDAIKKQTEEAKRENVDRNLLLYEGRSQNAIYAVPSLGIDPSTGQEMFLDENGNVTYEWRAAAKQYFGDDEQKYWGNISSLFSYRDFSVNLSFAYRWGGQAYNQTLVNKVEIANSQIQLYNVDRRVFSDRWQKPGDIKFFKGYSNTSTRMSSRFVMDDDVLEFQSANLQYNWHTPFVHRLGLETIRLNINMSDICYFSSIKRERGIDYPFARRVQFGMSLLF